MQTRLKYLEKSQKIGFSDLQKVAFELRHRWESYYPNRAGTCPHEAVRHQTAHDKLQEDQPPGRSRKGHKRQHSPHAHLPVKTNTDKATFGPPPAKKNTGHLLAKRNIDKQHSGPTPGEKYTPAKKKPTSNIRTTSSQKGTPTSNIRTTPQEFAVRRIRRNLH